MVCGRHLFKCLAGHETIFFITSADHLRLCSCRWTIRNIEFEYVLAAYAEHLIILEYIPRAQSTTYVLYRYPALASQLRINLIVTPAYHNHVGRLRVRCSNCCSTIFIHEQAFNQATPPPPQLPQTFHKYNAGTPLSHPSP
ncbi:uncharacterized protein BO95DRAFT_43702 [Aspergillus brunneoviolaceus CBS 621.78]|uniref:Uncharacterized protein n=1 Tax=Aspergillus brunneoviolaceus CBS 621.78 TaxID=1450534 RepID=A0ACD1GH28_9EURO|nr:hypothetical protein BO95DRAFT_43702 [Aspergillus brunneoviolaceus CBS 621.78]RAH48629.1 hypothetical protein BO95DRAFT_43702 [Aspergillus brunneoviolaceus CBS 621.78]